MLWAFFAILSASCWSIGNLVDKIALSKLIKQPMTAMIMLGAVSTVAIAVVAIGGAFSRFTLGQTALALVAGVTYTSMNVCYIQAVQREEISKIIPLFSLTPIMISFVAAITLHEVFLPITYAGIALILVGAVSVSIQRLESFRLNAAFWLMVGASASLTVTEVIQKYLLRFHPYGSVFAYSRLGSVLAILPIAWFYRQEMVDIIGRRNFKTLGFMSISEALNIMALLSIIYASSIGFVTLVNALTQVQPFIVLTLTVAATFFIPQVFREEQSVKILAHKLGSITVMFVGVLFLLKYQ